MNRYFNNISKSITALVLLSLMTFIFIAKVFHAHGNHSCNDVLVKVKIEKQHCAVCEYHFTHDADNVHAVITILPSFNFLPFNNGKVFNYAFTPLSTISLRGPPFSC